MEKKELLKVGLCAVLELIDLDDGSQMKLTMPISSVPKTKKQMVYLYKSMTEVAGDRVILDLFPFKEKLSFEIIGRDN